MTGFGRKSKFPWTDHERAIAAAEWLEGRTLSQISAKRGYAVDSTAAGSEITKFCTKYSGMSSRQVRESRESKLFACRKALAEFDRRKS